MARRKHVRLMIVFAPLLAVILAACGSGSSAKRAQTKDHASGNGRSSVATVKATNGSGGMHLVGNSGRAIYLWVADTTSRSTCSGACAENWPPVITKGGPRAGAGTDAADLGTATRSNGTRQVTYAGHPLYYYVGDPGPGSTTGEGSGDFGARWWLVAPSGHAITSTATGSGSYGSSYGG